MEKILLFNCEQEQKISAMASNMKIKTIKVDKNEYSRELGDLVNNGVAVSDSSHSNDSGESLILFCNLTDKHFDKMLAKLKESRVIVDYKAVLTATNSKWTVKKLFVHMEMEKMQTLH